MSIDDQALQAVVAILSPAGFGLWLRERRRSRKDAYGFALDIIEQHTVREAALTKRLDELTLKVGELQGKVSILSEENAVLRRDNVELKAARST